MRYFWVRVSNVAGSVYSDTSIVTVPPLIAFGDFFFGQTIQP